MSTSESNSHVKTTGEGKHTCGGATPKWAAIVDDQLIPMPRRQLVSVVIYEQARVPADQVLLRDHNSPNDPVIMRDDLVDLALGNVFYSAPACDVKARDVCSGPAKLGYVVDDRWEVVIPPEQTGRTIRDLFALPSDFDLLRDYESPVDQPITVADSALFADGPVMRTQKRHGELFIIVNLQRKTPADGVKPVMTGREIALLAYRDPEQTEVSKLEDSSKRGIPLTEIVHIQCGDKFEVLRKNVVAGFEDSRVLREIGLLQVGGGKVAFLPAPDGAVIYHDVPVRKGHVVEVTDVLVKVPPGYPASFIDCAFLPQGSPLLGLVPGKPQETASIGGRGWTRVSVHPHHGNGVGWDKDLHGFHTYFGEVLSWLAK